MKQALTGCVIALFCLGAGGARLAAQQAVTDGAKKVGEATVEGTKKAGAATAEGTKTAAKATTDTTAKAGTSVKNIFTGDVSVMCADGKKHSGKTGADACAKYGGVKP